MQIVKAMILAAGRGERMRPLTDHTPKPLLEIAGKPIIQHTIEQLVAADFGEIVINIAYLGDKIREKLGNGGQFGAIIYYSDEGNEALETAGGIVKALPLLGSGAFVAINGDIMHDYPLANLHQQPAKLAHLLLVDNPSHNRQGDFHLADGKVLSQGSPALTFSGIGVYQPDLFKEIAQGKAKLAPLLRKAMTKGEVTGEKFCGFWDDIGTVARFHRVQNLFASKSNVPS